jgi:AraC family transcriptional activator of pobA
MNKVGNYIPSFTIKTKEMKPLGFDIIELRKTEGRAYDSNQAHRHTFFELFYFTKSGGVHEIDFVSYPINEKSLHFVTPGQIHKLQLNGANGHVICFTEELVQLRPRESVQDKFPFYAEDQPQVFTMNVDLHKQFQVLLNSVIGDLKKSPGHTELFGSYLNLILLKIREEFMVNKGEKIVDPSKNTLVKQFKKLVNDHFAEHWSLTQYAEKLNISPNHLNALSKKHLGRPAVKIIQDRILLESRRLLLATNKTIKEISFMVGFEDMSYFNRFFKKMTGLSPGSLREQTHH